jgi:hypothetical protein
VQRPVAGRIGRELRLDISYNCPGGRTGSLFIYSVRQVRIQDPQGGLFGRQLSEKSALKGGDHPQDSTVTDQTIDRPLLSCRCHGDVCKYRIGKTEHGAGIAVGVEMGRPVGLRRPEKRCSI